MSLNINVLPKRASRSQSLTDTVDGMRGVSNALLQILDERSVPSPNGDAPDMRRRLAALGAEPLTRHWRVIWSQDHETKAVQHRWARRIGAIRGHQASWGFRKGRSCRDCCESHLTYWGVDKPGQMSFLSMDMENFFPSINSVMIREAMKAHGFSDGDIDECISVCTITLDESTLWTIIRMLSFGTRRDDGTSQITDIFGDTSSSTGMSAIGVMVSEVLSTGACRALRHLSEQNVDIINELVFRYICGFGHRTRLGDKILIQGSPASPALSNLVFKRADYRLAALAKSRGAFYSRYADDVTFSWRERRGKKWINMLKWSAEKVVNEHGFSVRRDKTVIKGPGMRQAMLGYNLNSGGITVSRARRRRVKDTLSKVVSGAINIDGRAFESIMGEVEFIATAHPELGASLRALGKEAAARTGVTGRISLHFDEVEDPGHQHHQRPIHL